MAEKKEKMETEVLQRLLAETEEKLKVEIQMRLECAAQLKKVEKVNASLRRKLIDAELPEPDPLSRNRTYSLRKLWMPTVGPSGLDYLDRSVTNLPSGDHESHFKERAPLSLAPQLGALQHTAGGMPNSQSPLTIRTPMVHGDNLLVPVTNRPSPSALIRPNTHPTNHTQIPIEEAEKRKESERQLLVYGKDLCVLMCCANLNIRSKLFTLFHQNTQDSLASLDMWPDDSKEYAPYLKTFQSRLYSPGVMYPIPFESCKRSPNSVAGDWQKAVVRYRRYHRSYSLCAETAPCLDSNVDAGRDKADSTSKTGRSSMAGLLPYSRKQKAFVVNALDANQNEYDRFMNRNAQNAQPIIAPDDEFDNLLENHGFSSLYAPGYTYEYDEQDSESNIVVTVDQDQQQIKCGTLVKLIERLTHEKYQDLNNRYVFLLSYHSFCSSLEFLAKLKSRYHVPFPPNLTPGELRLFKKKKLAPIQIKIFSVLQYWLHEHYSDFVVCPELTTALKSFIQEVIQESPWSSKSARNLEALLKKHEEGGKRVIRYTNSLPTPLIPVGMHLSDFVFSECPVMEIARQLTLGDFEAFQSIEPRECLDQNYNRKDKATRAPNIFRMTERFNHVSDWAQMEILSHENINKRVSAMKRMINIAKACFEINNLHSVFAIYGGLTANAIHRLKKTKELLSSKYKDFMDQFSSIASPERNYHYLRLHMQSLIAPCIPYIGIFLQDLTKIDDGNPDKLKNMINFMKRRKVSERIMWIKQFQQAAYQFQRVPVIHQYLDVKLISHNENELWKLSLQLEPRE